MLSTGNTELNAAIKTELASSSSLKSTHQVIAEWNYNAYTPYSSIGCLLSGGGTDDGNQNYTYTAGDNTAVTNTDTDRIKYTPLKDIFKTNRPNPGIVHGVANLANKNEAINGDKDSLSITRIFNLISEDTRVYPISKNSPFKYWSSIRKKNGAVIGISSSTAVSGEYAITDASPFIIYEDTIYVNKIVVKTQKHQGYATSFKIQGMISGTWTDLYTSTNSNVLQDGVLNIYHQGAGVWSEYTAVIDAPNEKVVTSFSKSSLDSNIVSLTGVRFLVQKMSAKNIPVEVIELSPRLVADITNSVTNLDIRSSVGNSAYGLPIGSVVSSSGSLSLSDYDSFFNKNNSDSILQSILKPNVEIKIYQKLTIENNLYRFPLKTMYSGIWEDADSLVVTTSLEDYFKFFREAAAPDLMIANNTGVPTSVALLMMLDNVGFTGFRFEKTSNDHDYEDVVMDFFYSKKEQTVLEVLEAVAISTQTSIYMDVDNELIAMTKEKMIAPETKDFWFIGNDGISEKTDNIVISITKYAGNATTTVTGTSPNNHGFSVGDKITISGATQTQQTKLNGTWTIASIPTNKTFTFVVSSSVSSGDLTTTLGVTRLVVPYISNIQSFSESSEPPITDVSIDYNGLGLEKKSLSLVNSNDDKKQQHLESPNFGASFINKDLRYTLDIVWQAGNDKGKSDNYLAAAAIIKDIPAQKPFDFFTDKTESANSKQDAIRQFYARSNESKVSLCMNLDKEMINTFINSYSGYVMIDTEIIRYNGILFFMSNPREKTFKKKILFSVEEYNFEKSKLRQGGSIEPEALIVYLDLETAIDSTDPSKNVYTLISDGRGQNKTEITYHKAVDTSKEFMQDRASDDWQKYGVQLWGPKRAVPTSIINSLTVTNRIDNFISNKTTGALMTSKSIPGYIKISSARSSGNIPSTKRPGSSISGTLSGTALTVSEANRLRLSIGSRLSKVSGTGVFATDTVVEKIISSTKVKITPTSQTDGELVFDSNSSDFLPIDNVSEQIVSGIFKTIKVKGSKIPIKRIGTRMRLVSDVPKNVDAGQTLIKDSCIAGIGWSISTTSTSSKSGIQGYFVEIEDVGKIDADSLLNENYRNLRFYKVVYEDNKHIPKLIRNAWVNVSSTPSTAPDMGTAITDAKGGGKTYAQIFDLEVVIRDKGNTRYYEIYWDDQQVIEASETLTRSTVSGQAYFGAIPETSVAGFITRGKSSAIYEYLYVSSSPNDIVVEKQSPALTKNKDQKLSSLASRGMLPDSLMQVIDNSKILVYFEDFGRYAREVKKFDTRFNSPSLKPTLISLSDVNPNYYVSDFQPSSFGASFWLYNTASSAIQIDESSQTPLWISAFSLKNINPGTVQSSKLVEKEEYDKEDDDRYTINRNVYGKQEIMLSGDFINNLEQAKSLATWITDNLSEERKSISLSIFPNPILELGDKVGLLYSDKLYNDSTKTYTISSISHTISNSGPTMNIEIRECV